MKPCPYCAAQIQDVAVKCRYCGELLDDSLRAPSKRKKRRGVPVWQRLLVGIGWRFVLYFGANIVTGAIAGCIAGAKDPEHPMEAAARSVQSARWLIPYYAIGAAILSIAGAATGVFLPGRRERSR